MTDDTPTPEQDAADSPQPEEGTEEDARAATSPTAEAEAQDGEGDDDATTSPEPPAPPEPPPPPTPEELLAAAKADTKAMRDKMLRIAADFENFRKRAGREADDSRKRGTLNAVKDLLPVFDNLERATAHVEESPETAAIVEGLKLVHKQFIDVLGRMGIVRVGALGTPFDPAVHESIQYLHSDEHAAGIVMSELQPGYRLGDTLLRPAMVVVSRGPAEEPAAAAAENTADASDAEEPASEQAEPAEEPAVAEGPSEAQGEADEPAGG